MLRTLSAHGYGQVITIASTLAIPSVAVAKWGVEGFGYWVTLVAFAQFFMMSDLGASTALANQLCLKANRSSEDAWALTQSVILEFIKKGVIALGIILVVAIVVALYYSNDVDTKNALFIGLTFFALALSSAFQPAQVIYNAAWRFVGRNEVGIFIFNTTRLFDLGIIVGVALSGGQMPVAAAVVTVIKLVTVLLIYFHLPYLIMEGKAGSVLGNKDARHNELNVLSKAGHGFTLISVSQQLTLHGPVLLISVLLGPIQAAIFAACRTISRLPVQPLTVLLASLNPELTELIANKQYKQLKIIVRRVLFGVMALSIIVGVCSVLFVEVIEKYWLAGKLDLDVKVLVPLCLAAMFYLCGQVINQTLTAANKTREQSKQFMVVGVLMMTIMLPLLRLSEQTMWGAIVVLVEESIMTALLLRRYLIELVDA